MLETKMSQFCSSTVLGYMVITFPHCLNAGFKDIPIKHFNTEWGQNFPLYQNLKLSALLYINLRKKIVPSIMQIPKDRLITWTTAHICM